VVFVAHANDAFDVIAFALTEFKNFFGDDPWKTFYGTERLERFEPQRNNSAGPFQFVVRFCRIKEASIDPSPSSSAEVCNDPRFSPSSWRGG
jgi:hypothetical protein